MLTCSRRSANIDVGLKSTKGGNHDRQAEVR
nr:MAG TPA_asm: hypothetical protein [Caudoviricetes sp.]